MNIKNIIIVTGDYGSGKTTIVSELASQFFCHSLIFDFTVRVADQSKFTGGKVSTILMGCNGCADSNAYIRYIVDSCKEEIETLFVEVPNDRINLGQVILGLEEQGYAVHVVGIGTEEVLNQIKQSLLQTFADINMSYAKSLPEEITKIEDLYMGHGRIGPYEDIEKLNNHNAGGFLKPYIVSEDIIRIKDFVQQYNTSIERCKGQLYYQGDEQLQVGWYDIEWSKKNGWKIEKIDKTDKTGIINHSLALVSNDPEIRKQFNDKMLWKYIDNTGLVVSVKPETINKPKMLCYEVLLGGIDKFDALSQRIKNSSISDEDYDYWLLFANSMKKWTSFIDDSQRKDYYSVYYTKKIETLKNFGFINYENSNQYLITLANLIYLLRGDTLNEITINEDLIHLVYNSYSLEERYKIINSALLFSFEGGIREFDKNRVLGYIEIINAFMK